MKLPNFVGIGAAKSGTTWLTRCLGEHPDIFMAPVKETEFWKFPDAEQRLDDYATYFKGVQNEGAIGEFSVRYLSFPGVPERLKRNAGRDVADLLRADSLGGASPATRARAEAYHERLCSTGSASDAAHGPPSLPRRAHRRLRHWA